MTGINGYLICVLRNPENKVDLLLIRSIELKMFSITKSATASHLPKPSDIIPFQIPKSRSAEIYKQRAQQQSSSKKSISIKDSDSIGLYVKKFICLIISLLAP